MFALNSPRPRLTRATRASGADAAPEPGDVLGAFAGRPSSRGLARSLADAGDATDLVAQLAFRTSVLQAQSEAVDEGLLLVSPTGEIIAYNRRFAEQWGFDDALLETQSDDAALAAAVSQLHDPDAFLDRVRYLYAHPDELSTDELHFHDGRILERFSAPVRGEDGTYYGRVWSFRDITQQRQVERSLAQRAAEQNALYRFTDRLHHARSLDDVYQAAIESILAALGCDRASLLLFDENDFMGFVASRGLSDEYRRAVNGHTPWRPEDVDAEPIAVGDIVTSDLEPSLKETVLAEGIRAFAFVPLAGAERLMGKFMVYYDAPHAFSQHELNLALTVARQIAFGIERRRAEEERERAEQALREADRRKDEFLATLAHELRNPLAPMHNALPLLARRLEAGEDVSRLLEVLDRQTSRLRRLVDDLMDVSRITRGHVDLRREVVDLRAVAERAVDAATEQPGAEFLAWDVRLPSAPVPVFGDPVRLEQVIHNLLANALKYTESGGRVGVTVEASDDSVQLSVTDTGIGIDPAFIGQVFDFFRQADRTLDRSQGGLGVGLTVARQLVELHGGTIEARSEGLGAGSAFVVRLPLSAGAAPSDERATAPAAGDTVRRRVLVVDDNMDQSDVLAELIGELGHEAHAAYDGSEALRLVGELRPDIVLLDIGLPGMDGYELAARLRADDGNAGLVIAALTGYSQPADRERSAKAGFDVHIVKPIQIDVLERLLETGSAS